MSVPELRAPSLAQRLAEAEATIAALLDGQIDAVVDAKTQSPVLLLKAQEALRQSEERYRRIVETTREGVWMLDAAHKTTFMNSRMAEMLRCELGLGLGTSPFQFLDDDEGEKLAAHLQRTDAGQIQLCFTRTDGATVLTLLEAAPLFDRAGRYEGSMVMVVDITESKQAEIALRQALADTRTAQERLRFVLESADVGIWDLDYKTGVLSWSPTLERQYGLAAGEFTGTFESFTAMIYADDRESTLAAMSRATQAGTDFSVDHRIVRPDGQVRTVHGVGRVHLDANGAPDRSVGISIDVTERNLLESRSRQAQKMDAVGQLASGVAHDFNNLLTVILGFAEFVTEDATVNDRNRRDVGEIIKAARRASGLTKQLLAFSRQQILETVPLDVNKLITDMTGMLGRLIGEHIEIAMELGSRLPLALSDRGQLEQVLMNLLVNARDAMPDGGKVTIRTSHLMQTADSGVDAMVAAGNYVVFTVTDTGRGMSKETQRRLFEPFFTTKETGKGTGLGLSTAYGIVKQSKGYIFVDSEIAKGTTFRVYLPCAAADARVHSVAAPAKHAAGAASELILLVEDELGVREFSRRCLERGGYRVLVAVNSTEAEQLFAQRAAEIELLLTDVVMPGCGGPELLARLRRSRSDLKVLYMSGYTEQSATNQAAFRGGHAVLQKPFTGSDLRRRVRDALDRDPQHEESQ